jgi:hypothetical protein
MKGFVRNAVKGGWVVAMRNEWVPKYDEDGNVLN